jgi:superfamily II RNA helicase
MDEIKQFKTYTDNIFEFSDFQTEACLSIIEDKHVLVTAHTGSGKTLPAEFSIYYNIKVKGKKVIYTSPIKALSNQKYKEFSTKFPDIEVGILTGDIKHNPTADLLIVTTEILQNHCFKTKNKGLYLDFNIDLENELGSVVFDEVHYIDDVDRGTVWEQTMILLPDHVPFVMLSATIGKKDYFANWIMNITNKEVTICSSDKRVVPLIFYEFFVLPDKYIKNIKDKRKKDMFMKKTNSKLNTIKQGNSYHYNHLLQTKKCTSELTKDKYRVHDKFVINECLEHLKQSDMFPCLLFVFSRKQVENISKQIFIDLFLPDEKDYMVRPFFTKMLVHKLENWKEYVNLPECEFYIELLEKGIGVHHAGMLPVFREIMEIMYEAKYIKVLIATETFAIGLNMPTRTVIFNSLFKHDGTQMRVLQSHEFIQMAGRAGRRNIDKIGHVILLTNNYQPLCESEYQGLFHNKPKVLTSKFRITYNLILNYLENFSQNDFVEMIQKSLMHTDIVNQVNASVNEIAILNNKISTYNSLLDSSIINHFENYDSLKSKHQMSSNKYKKKIKKEIIVIETGDEFAKYELYQNYMNLVSLLRREESVLNYTSTYIETQLNVLFDILQKNGYVSENMIATPMGLNASYIHELPSLVFCDLYKYCEQFDKYSETQIVCLLSSFYDLKVKEDYKTHYPSIMKKEFAFIEERLNYYKDRELPSELYITSKTNIQYDLIDYIEKWFNNIETIDDTRFFFHELTSEIDIFTGDFIKCCMKLVNMCNELVIFSENDNNYSFLEKLNNIKRKLQKSIVSSKSLYV